MDHATYQSNEVIKLLNEFEEEIVTKLEILHDEFIKLLGQLKRELKAKMSLLFMCHL